jgi:hypothetical protein
LRTVLKRVAHSFGACVSGAGNCPYGGGSFTALTGSITIPANYASNVQCDYLITTGKPIYVIFDSFSTEEAYDFVTVYDGMSVTGTLLGQFSGTPTPGVLAAKSGSVFVRFTSDSSGSLDGFGMRWSNIAPPTLAPTASPTFTGGTPSHANPDEDAFMLLRACITTRVLVCAGFALGARGSNDCPANYFRIVAEDLCRSAAAAAGKAYQGRETNNLFPRGCNLKEGEGGVFFNDATGAGSSESKLLCSGAPLRYSTVIESLQGRCLCTEVIARKAQGRGDRGALRSCCKVRLGLAVLQGSHRPADPIVRSSISNWLSLCSDGLADDDADQPGRHKPTDGLAHALSDLRPRWYCLHPMPLVGTGLPRSARRTPHGL